MSWLRNAVLQATKPQHSIIGVLKQNLGGSQPGRSMKILHASDVTRVDFCPRRWAFFDLFGKQPPMEHISTAMDVTFRMGRLTETQVVEEWAGDAVVGNWRCRLCFQSRSFTSRPKGFCNTGKAHWWQYMQTVVEAPTHGLQGAIDALFNIGAPQVVVTEVKTMNPVEFEAILAPLPEHRLRTNLYLWILDQSPHSHKEKINTQEARVLYISRGYGKLNPTWNEILPFKEFVIKRNDADLAEFLTRAQRLQVFRTLGLMPLGICATALDKAAKQCSVVTACFSGAYVPGKHPPPAQE